MLRGRTAKRIMALLFAVVFLQGLVLAASLPRSNGGSSSDAGLETVALETPALSWEHPDGRSGSLSDLRGRPTLVHFWASWCPACRAELPSLLDYADRAPVEVVAVSLDDRWPAILPLVPDTRATVVRTGSAEAARAFGTQSVPETWLVDADGTVRARLSGPGDWTSPRLRTAVIDTLGSAGAATGPSGPAPSAEPAEGCEFPEPPATKC